MNHTAGARLFKDQAGHTIRSYAGVSQAVCHAGEEN